MYLKSWTKSKPITHSVSVGCNSFIFLAYNLKVKRKHTKYLFWYYSFWMWCRFLLQRIKGESNILQTFLFIFCPSLCTFIYVWFNAFSYSLFVCPFRFVLITLLLCLLLFLFGLCYDTVVLVKENLVTDNLLTTIW